MNSLFFVRCFLQGKGGTIDFFEQKQANRIKATYENIRQLWNAVYCCSVGNRRCNIRPSCRNDTEL